MYGEGCGGVGRRATAGSVWEVVGTEGDLIVERLLDGLMDG